MAWVMAQFFIFTKEENRYIQNPPCLPLQDLMGGLLGSATDTLDNQLIPHLPLSSQDALASCSSHKPSLWAAHRP